MNGQGADMSAIKRARVGGPMPERLRRQRHKASVPVLVGQYDAHPAVMAAIGMASAYENAVIRAYIPTALPRLAANIVLFHFLMNRSP